MLDILTATAQVAPDLVKVPLILSDIVVRRSAVEWDLTPYQTSEKKQISQGDQQVYYLQVFQRFYETQNKNQQGSYRCRPPSNILKDKGLRWNFQQSGKQLLF